MITDIDESKFQKHPEPCLICSIKETVLIEHWSIFPCDGAYVLYGDVMNHPKLGYRANVTTTIITEVDYKSRHVKTGNTEYILGERRNYGRNSTRSS